MKSSDSDFESRNVTVSCLDGCNLFDKSNGSRYVDFNVKRSVKLLKMLTKLNIVQCEEFKTSVM